MFKKLFGGISSVLFFFGSFFDFLLFDLKRLRILLKETNDQLFKHLKMLTI